MATLDRWRAFLSTPKTLIFPKLELIGRDHEPPLVVGCGEVRMTSPHEFDFTLKGAPADPGYVLREIRAQRDAPYDALARFRLLGIDSEGVSWAGGYTVPAVDTDGSDWTFRGVIDSLTTDERTSTVASELGTELIFLVPRGHLMALAMARFARQDQASGKSRREHVMDILGSTVRFAYEPDASTLTVTATHSTALIAPYAENWLAEPFRIMFGHLVYPRLVARNFGDGRAIVWVRRSPGLIRSARWAALLDVGQVNDKATFWTSYAGLLRLVALARDANGEPNFEANKLTHLYEEIIQASLGSRWVWALTFATSIEALVKILNRTAAAPSQNDAEAISEMIKHIKNWTGDNRLKQAAIGAVHRTAEVTTVRAMRTLETEGVITQAQRSAWQTIRNAVAHGSLMSRYSEPEEDQQLLALSAMMHALTWELIRQSDNERGKASGADRG